MEGQKIAMELWQLEDGEEPREDATTVSRSIESEEWSPSEVSSLSGDSGQRDLDFMAYFRNHRIHGRQEELDLLEKAYRRTKKSASEVVVIHGDEGCGKSFLVESMRTPTTDKQGYFLSGKFDQRCESSAPFSAITEALSDLCDLIIQEREFEADECEAEGVEYDAKPFQTQLLDKIGMESASVLACLVSNFALLVGIKEEQYTANYTEALDKFKSACLQFLRSTAIGEQQVFMFLDDLQNADSESLQVVESFINDTSSINVLLVCTFRDHETKENNEVLTELFFKKKDGLKIREVQLQNLTPDSTNKLLAEMLSKNEASSKRLSEVVMTKTHGNPFFIKNYVDLLRSEGYLRYVKNTWTWDISAISAGTTISDNVVEIVESKIQMLHPHVQGMLKIASCLGFQFPRDVLDQFALETLAAGDASYMDAVKDHMTRCLELVIREGLLEPTRSGSKYKFSHDRVRQCCADLLPSDEEERQELHQRIGQVVWSLSHEGTRDWYVLAAAQQLNKGAHLVVEKDEKLFHQNVNIKACKIAKSKSAFGPAAEYVQAAIGYMDGENDWANQYQVMLTLNCMAAELFNAAGRFEDCKTHAEIVFEHARTSFDKMPAYLVMTECLGTQCFIDETIAMATKALAQLGHKIPRKPKQVRLVFEVASLKRLLKGKEDEEILALPSLQSKEELAAMTLFCSLLTFAFVANEPDLIGIIVVRMMKISIKHGISRATPACLACWGIVIAQSSAQEAHRYGVLSLKLARQMDLPSALPLTIGFAHGFLIHKNAPLKQSLVDLEEGFNVGVNVGQLFPAACCRMWCTTISMFSGVPLLEGEREMRAQCESMRERNQHLTLNALLPLWQLMLNLIGDGRNENPIVITGMAMDRDERLQAAVGINNSSAQFAIHFAGAFLSVFYGSWTTASERLKEMKQFEKSYKEHFLFYVINLFRGLTAYENYRRSEKRHFLVEGRRITKEMNVMADSGTITCKAFLKLLIAEDTTTKENMTDTAKAYDQAIAACKECNLIPFEALACERAGTFMHRENMTLLTEQYLTRAMLLYKDWGARTKRSRLGLLMQGLPTASRYNMTFVGTLNDKTIDTDANVEPVRRRKANARRTSKYSLSASLLSESFAMDSTFHMPEPTQSRMLESAVVSFR